MLLHTGCSSPRPTPPRYQSRGYAVDLCHHTMGLCHHALGLCHHPPGLCHHAVGFLAAPVLPAAIAFVLQCFCGTCCCSTSAAAELQHVSCHFCAVAVAVVLVPLHLGYSSLHPTPAPLPIEGLWGCCATVLQLLRCSMSAITLMPQPPQPSWCCSTSATAYWACATMRSACATTRRVCVTTQWACATTRWTCGTTRWACATT